MLRRLSRALLILWSLPYGLLGLLVATPFRLCGRFEVARTPELNFPALVVAQTGPVGRLFTRLGWAGFTLGWVFFLWNPAAANPTTIRHEGRHVEQGLVLGIFFPAVYLVVLLALATWWLWRDGATAIGAGASLRKVVVAALAWAYKHHPLERDARKAAALT